MTRDTVNTNAAFVGSDDASLGGSIKRNLIRSESDATTNQSISTFMNTNADNISDFLSGELIDCVELDDVVCVSFTEFDGHVYNLENKNNWYVANDIVTHNCRSTLVPYDDKFIKGRQPFVRVEKNDDGKFLPAGKLTKKQKEKLGYKVGSVEAGTSYSKWFATQDAAFQKDWLGPSKYKLYKEGGYDISRFVDPVGKPYTLAELAAKDAATFKRLGFNVK